MRVKGICSVLIAGSLLIGSAGCANALPAETPKVLQIELNARELELATGESYAVVSTVRADGTVVSGAEVAWSSSDPEVATVDNGTIRAMGEGRASVQALCQYGGKEASATVKLTVKKPAVALEAETPVIIDLSREYGGVVTLELPVDTANVDSVTIGENEYRVVKQDGQTLISTAFMMPGEYTMTVEQENQTIRFPVYIASMVIRDAEDLQKATKLASADTGYFVLGCNIDCADLNEPICFLEESYFETSLGQDRQGFRGGFNGMGYAISDLRVPANGLFGCIGASGVVRDLALVNISSPDPDASVLCRDSVGLISQVYVQGDFCRVMFASYGPANKLENIVAESVRSGALLCQHIASVDTEGYSVSDVRALIIVGPEAMISGWSRNGTFSNLSADVALKAYAGASKESIPAVTEEDGFNGYWDITNGYPIFISSVQ